jgi:hypothetical protein
VALIVCVAGVALAATQQLLENGRRMAGTL